MGDDALAEIARTVVERIDRHCTPGSGWRRRSCPVCGNLGEHADRCSLEALRAVVGQPMLAGADQGQPAAQGPAGVAAGPQATPTFCGADLDEYGRCELPTDLDGVHAGAPPDAQQRPDRSQDAGAIIGKAEPRSMPRATHDSPDQVLVDTVTKTMATADYSAIVEDHSWVDTPTGGSFTLPVPPGTRVRVVAVPTDHEDQL